MPQWKQKQDEHARGPQLRLTGVWPMSEADQQRFEALFERLIERRVIRILEREKYERGEKFR